MTFAWTPKELAIAAALDAMDAAQRKLESQIRVCGELSAVDAKQSDENKVYFAEQAAAYRRLSPYCRASARASPLSESKTMLPSLLIDRALFFASKAHEGQTRKYTGEPYVMHPMAVALMVVEYEPHEDVIAAALLHDVVEDCGVSLETIGKTFGLVVRDLVYWLTDASTPEDGNRAARKKIDREHIAQAPSWAQTIKCCDIIDNTLSIVVHDPAFAPTYLKEKRLLLGVMHRAHHEAHARAWATLEEAEQSLRASVR